MVVAVAVILLVGKLTEAQGLMPLRMVRPSYLILKLFFHYQMITKKVIMMQLQALTILLEVVLVILKMPWEELAVAEEGAMYIMKTLYIMA
uniref:Uncharacterized protein n=1 Tax=viral metagenome TaxID=1070528 RepID=A0A6C0LDW8_9ZZZZ